MKGKYHRLFSKNFRNTFYNFRRCQQILSKTDELREIPTNSKLFFFPKRFLSWGFKTLFASASSCQCIPPSVFVAGWAMSGESRSAGILGAHKILAELLCLCRAFSRNSIAATPSRSDFIYTEMVARRRFEFYLHRDGCMGKKS